MWDVCAYPFGPAYSIISSRPKIIRIAKHILRFQGCAGILLLASAVPYVVPEIGETHDPSANEDGEGSIG